MPAALRLEELVRRGTFRSRRHRHLLEGRVVPWPQLAAIQLAYLATTNEHERRHIGCRFEEAVRGGVEETTDPRRDYFDRLIDAGVVGPADVIDLASGVNYGPDRTSRVVFAGELVAFGYTVDEIAHRLDVSVSTVRGYLRQLEKAS
jgi:hypothetical protein